jgi:DNA-binding NarL/FixJ family response regulator
MKIRILVAEDHILMTEAIVGQLKQHAEIEVVATAADGPTLFGLARQHQPDVILLDLSMPDFDPLPGVKTIQRECPNARCIVLTGDDTPFFIHTMIDAGVSGLFQVAMAPMIDKAFCTELPKWRMAAAMFSQPS